MNSIVTILHLKRENRELKQKLIEAENRINELNDEVGRCIRKIDILQREDKQLPNCDYLSE